MVLRLCDQKGRAHAGPIACYLRNEEQLYFQEFAASGFKALVLKAREDGAPLRWIQSATSTDTFVQLELDSAIRSSLRSTVLSSISSPGQQVSR